MNLWFCFFIYTLKANQCKHTIQYPLIKIFTKIKSLSSWLHPCQYTNSKTTSKSSTKARISSQNFLLNSSPNSPRLIITHKRNNKKSQMPNPHKCDQDPVKIINLSLIIKISMKIRVRLNKGIQPCKTRSKVIKVLRISR